MGIDSTSGVAVAAREVAGRMYWAVAAGVLRRHCKKPGWGMVVMAAVVAGMGRARRMTAAELTADRIEGMAAATVTGSWAAVGRMGRRCSCSSSRCLDTKVWVRRRGSGGTRWRWDEACRTWHWSGYTCWTDAPRACDRST